MKKIYFLLKIMPVIFGLMVTITAKSQSMDSLVITMGEIELAPHTDTVVTAEYWYMGELQTDAKIKFHTEPGYLGKANRSGVLTANHPGEGWLFAKYKELRDSVRLVVTGTPKPDDDDDDMDDDDDDMDDDDIDDDDYPKVKIVPGSVKVYTGDSVELYAFYVDSLDRKIDTTFTWSVEPADLGMFPDPEASMFHAGDMPGHGMIIATLGDLADTIKVKVLEPKVKPHMGNNGHHGEGNSKGKQLTIMPGDMVVYAGAEPIDYDAMYKTNGNAHQGLDYMWSVSDTSIATIDADGVLTLKGETGFTLVNCEYSNFGASVELLVVDSTVDMEVNTIKVHRVLPNGKELKAKTFKEGDSYKIGGLPFPLNLLNGGRIHFPFGCIDEDITIYMFIPEEYAKMNDDSTEVTLSEGNITGVKFNVKPAGVDSIVEPYWFNVPIELTLVYKQELLDSLGIDPMDLDVFFADNTGFVDDGTGIASIDTARSRIHASIEHFSTIVVRKGNVQTTVKEVIDESEETLEVFPNPFSTSTQLRYKLAAGSNVNITVYNLFGQTVKVLVDKEMTKGTHMVSWNGETDNGAPAQSGIYLCRMIKDGKVTQVKRLVLNR